MTEVMVSVRMPKSLLSELKDLSQTEHYLDVSELVRSLTRKHWLQYANPELFELQKLRSDIEQEIRKKSIEKVREEVNKELENIKSQLKKGGLLE